MTAMKAPSKSVLCLAVFCSLFAAFTVLADDIPSQDISTGKKRERERKKEFCCFFKAAVYFTFF